MSDNAKFVELVTELGITIFTDALFMSSQIPNDDHAEAVLQKAADVMEGLSVVREAEAPRAALESFVAQLESAPHDRDTHNTQYRADLPVEVVTEVYNSTLISVTRKLLEV